MDSQDEKHGLLAYGEHPGSNSMSSKDDLPTLVTPRRSFRSFRSSVWSLGLAALLTMTAFTFWGTSSFKHCQKVMPLKSIEERVHKILSETPLIGR